MKDIFIEDLCREDACISEAWSKLRQISYESRVARGAIWGAQMYIDLYDQTLELLHQRIRDAGYDPQEVEF